MKSLFFILLIPILFIIPVSTNAFAQSTYDVNIPTGAANPDAPYFWQSEKDGSTTGIIEILVDDTIIWKNADTATHTVTSGIPSTGYDDLFDSGLFPPGKSFSNKFQEIGHYPYFCSLHPWMDGMVIVTAGYFIIPNVGKEIGDGSTFFNVEYDFNRLLYTTEINEDQKSISFEIIGDAQSNNHDLELRLPTELIDGNLIIWVDGKKFSDYEQFKEDGLNILYIPLDADSNRLTVIGTTIIPEFGSITMIILIVSVVSMVIFSHKFRLSV